jgi:hypothetical protein
MTNPTPRSDAIRDFLIKQAIGTLNTKFGITDAEPGWFPEEWTVNTLQQVLYALGTTQDPDESQPVINHCGDISVVGFKGHITVTVKSTVVYFHNRS